MKVYTISEVALKSFIEEGILLEMLMEMEPDLNELKDKVCQEEGCSWDQLVDANMKRFIELRCIDVASS